MSMRYVNARYVNVRYVTLLCQVARYNQYADADADAYVYMYMNIYIVSPVSLHIPAQTHQARLRQQFP